MLCSGNFRSWLTVSLPDGYPLSRSPLVFGTIPHVVTISNFVFKYSHIDKLTSHNLQQIILGWHYFPITPDIGMRMIYDDGEPWYGNKGLWDIKPSATGTHFLKTISLPLLFCHDWTQLRKSYAQLVANRELCYKKHLGGAIHSGASDEKNSCSTKWRQFRGRYHQLYVHEGKLSSFPSNSL